MRGRIGVRRLVATALGAVVATVAAAAPATAQVGALVVAPSCIPFPSTPFHFEARQVTVIGDIAHLVYFDSTISFARISDLRVSADPTFVGDVSGTAELLDATHTGTYELRLYVVPSPTFGESAVGSIQIGNCPPPAAQLASMVTQVRALGLHRPAELRLVLELRVAQLLVRARHPRLASLTLRRFEADASRLAGDAAAALRAESAAIRAVLR